MKACQVIAMAFISCLTVELAVAQGGNGVPPGKESRRPTPEDIRQSTDSTAEATDSSPKKDKRPRARRRGQMGR